MQEAKLGVERIELDEATRGEFSLNTMRYVFASQYANSGSILDIACGTGYGATILSRTSKFCVGADIDSDAIKRSKAACDNDRISFVQCDCHHLPFRRGVFELVTSMETIEHLADPQRFLEELAGCVKGGGRVVISTPNRGYKAPWVRDINPYHLHEWVPEEIESLATEALGDIDMYFQWPSVRQRVLDNLMWTVRKSLRLMPRPIEALLLRVLRWAKLFVFGAAPKRDGSELPSNRSYRVTESNGFNHAGVKRPQTIVIVARKRPGG